MDPESRIMLFETLPKYNVGSVITDVAGRRDCAHMELTTPHALIRFVGNNLHPTDYTRADAWEAFEYNAPINAPVEIKQVNTR